MTAPSLLRFVDSFERALNAGDHLDDTPWFLADVPPRQHRCFVQSLYREFGIARCACGALKFVSGSGAGLWGERNTRKRSPDWHHRMVSERYLMPPQEIPSELAYSWAGRPLLPRIRAFFAALLGVSGGGES